MTPEILPIKLAPYQGIAQDGIVTLLTVTIDTT